MTIHGASLLSLGALLAGCAAHTASTAARTGEPAAASAGPAAAPDAGPDGARYGSVHFPVSCSPDAQRQFDLAVAQLHSFFYPETVKSFARVLEIDPSCAVAYWGLARSQPPNPLVTPFPPGTWQRGREAVAKGKALGAPTPRERDWLDAAEAYVADPDDVPYAVRIARYVKAMERLARTWPDDAEAQIFYALALIESADPHDLAYDNQYRAARILEALQGAHPRHPGITHYVIHAYDYSPIAGKGLAAANEYARIAPSAPHALHMPSHTYCMLGMWRQAIASDQASIDRAREYAAATLPPDVHYVGEIHSLDFQAYAFLQTGQEARAREVVALAGTITKANSPIIVVDTALSVIPVRYALERGDWAAAAALPPRPSAYPYAEAVRLFGRALGAAYLGDPAHLVQARADIERMNVLREGYTGPSGQSYWAEQTEILILAATARLERASGNDALAVRLLRRAADLEDGSEKHVAMENRVFSTREQLAYLLLELQLPREALTEFESSFRSTPNRLRGHRGAVRAAELAGEHGTAQMYREKLRALVSDDDARRAEATGVTEAPRALTY